MKYRMIAKIEGLKIKENLNRGFLVYENIRISNGPQVINKYFSTDDFVEAVGGIEHSNLIDSTYIYSVGETNQSLETHDERIEFLDKLLEIARLISNSTWFLMDNSVSLDLAFLHTPETSLVTSNSWAGTLKNCLGLDQTIEITKSEMIVNFEKLNAFNIENSLNDADIIRYESGNSKLSRAFLYLTTARSQYLIPMKIAFYVTCMEALFSSDNSEVSHKIAERMAFYLADEKEERLRIYILIKEAYKIRSSSVHGSRLSKKSGKVLNLERVSIEVDALIRTVFNKILTTECESDKFFDNDEKNFNDFISEIVFG